MQCVIWSPDLIPDSASTLTDYLTVDDWNNGNQKHIDIWTGTPSTNGGNAQIQCENALTPNGGQQVLRSPPNNLAVDSMCRLHNIITPPSPCC